jgi:hypothetical protein
VIDRLAALASADPSRIARSMYEEQRGSGTGDEAERRVDRRFIEVVGYASHTKRVRRFG